MKVGYYLILLKSERRYEMKKGQIKTRIISGFPGIGKTYFCNNSDYLVLDSDSSQYSWVLENGVKKRNPDFPANYIQHIKDNIGKYEFILVSSHLEVREALKLDCLFFYLIYPNLKDKMEYLKRYAERGSDDAFVKLLSDNWDNWIKELYMRSEERRVGKECRSRC